MRRVQGLSPITTKVVRDTISFLSSSLEWHTIYYELREGMCYGTSSNGWNNAVYNLPRNNAKLWQSLKKRGARLFGTLYYKLWEGLYYFTLSNVSNNAMYNFSILFGHRFNQTLEASNIAAKRILQFSRIVLFLHLNHCFNLPSCLPETMVVQSNSAFDNRISQFVCLL